MSKRSPKDLLEVRKSEVPRYSLHPARIPEWLGGDDDPAVEGMPEAAAAMTFIQDRLIQEFPRKAIPHEVWEFSLGHNLADVRVPAREHVCSAVDEVSMVMGLSRTTNVAGGHPTPDAFTAPACVVETVTEAFRIYLHNEFVRGKPTRDCGAQATISDIVSDAILSARAEAICSAVDRLDGLTPDCDRDWIHINVRARQASGPPDPFGSKSRFRYDLMRALVWWSLPKKSSAYMQKSADKVTEGDLTNVFCLLGYLGRLNRNDRPRGSTPIRPRRTDSGGEDRTVRRWLLKYTRPNWPTVRSELTHSIRRTGYPLT